MNFTAAEFNTLVTGCGMLCATVQGATGGYAFWYRRKPVLLRSNEVLFRAHRAFGSFATAFYLVGLVAGTVGFVGAVTVNEPPLELESASFNVHTWGSFPVVVVWAWKTWLSYFRKGPLYAKRRWLGPALVAAWAFTWFSAATSYYVRTLPSNLQHPPPVVLLPYEWFWAQLLLPILLGGALAVPIMRGALKAEAKVRA